MYYEFQRFPQQLKYKEMKEGRKQLFGISSRVLLSVPIFYLIYLLFKVEIFPNYRKSAIVDPMLKSDDPTEFANYRPIIFPVISNVAER